VVAFVASESGRHWVRNDYLVAAQSKSEKSLRRACSRKDK